MDVINKTRYLQRVWQMALPHLPVPTPKDIRWWLDYELDTLESSILQSSHKFAPSKLSPSFDVNKAYRYVTATAKGIATAAKSQALEKIRREFREVRDEVTHDHS